ncbi:hypothetical protein HQ325_12935 [Rhodococcus sp. BP-349]|uniref:hypothetical protein n=1 Tax=unclassified Rhodococcus (in: high G+C Gram-positive bacteria) TaxID=192944 RepID=UPI001C9BB33C|nr:MULTISPECIES: hypothetical protein [unclassified Rhodococcus (in: high G+C Gram-positive bacteria)]MBY6539580.1 hypothetical protein [Rhodococcus sp. BP-363]MBY6544092.1 hypothetical protein [Rhodococcus sp. BP-369]MBY6563322.1 hypothetical protein [Rhodococcus sp. BP-370]MBY6577614.1 hypothetical protein [Rhodococcus sp. BP-364]MBY6586915.1 hypothetical protein [Rhodococcus sp. BP-358]
MPFSMSTRAAVAAALVAGAAVLGACSAPEQPTSATAVPAPAETSVVTPTSVVAPTGTPVTAPSEPPTDAAADQPDAEEQPVDQSPSTVSPADALPRPGSQEVSVDTELFRDSGGAGEGYYFRTPSGNVSCGLFPNGTSVGFLGCQAVSSVAPDEGEVCSNGPASKYAVRVESTGPIHYCTNQGYFTGSENIRTLQYGEVINTGQSFCVSREDGVACARVGSNAFFLSRDENTTLR